MTNKLARYADLTLRDALAAFRADEGLAEKYADTRSEAKIHFDRHDIVHVLFGLDTSMQEEAEADGWTLFGTDITWREIREFEALPEEKELIREVGIWAIVRGYLKAVPDFARIALRSRHLKRRWPWSGEAAYLDRKVADIRHEFGIVTALA